MTTLPDPARFAHVTDWVFDLDNTLYPHHSNLFSQIDVKMTAYVGELLALPRDEARKLLASQCDTHRVRGLLETDAPYDRELWATLAANGYLGTAIDEAHGGLGLGRVTLCVIAEEVGRAENERAGEADDDGEHALTVMGAPLTRVE